MAQPRARRPVLVAMLGAVLALGATPVRAQAGFMVQAWPVHQVPPLQAGFDASGQALLLKDLRGQALLINFWASWCEPCREEMPSLALLSQSQPSRLRVVAVNFKESPDTVSQWVATTGWTLPLLRDPDGALARAWGIRVFPSTVLIGADGRVRSVVRGALDWNGGAAERLIAPLFPAPVSSAPLLPGVRANAAPKPGPAGPG